MSTFKRSSRLRALPVPVAVATVALGAYVLHRHYTAPISNDAQPLDPADVKNQDLETRPKVLGKTKVGASTADAIAAAGEYDVWVWGSNRSAYCRTEFPAIGKLTPCPRRNNTLLPPGSGTPIQNMLKTARPTPYIPKATPLRDLVLAEKYAAAVDARGDLWLWGNGYWDESLRTIPQGQKDDDRSRAQKSLRGKVCRHCPDARRISLSTIFDRTSLHWQLQRTRSMPCPHRETYTLLPRLEVFSSRRLNTVVTLPRPGPLGGAHSA